jgi:hypothetical protein
MRALLTALFVLLAWQAAASARDISDGEELRTFRARLHYTLVALATALMPLLMLQWNLLGFRY